MKARLPHKKVEQDVMNTINKGIDYTIAVSGLNKDYTYTASLVNAATKNVYSVEGFFIGDKCYFIYPKTKTITFTVGSYYQLNIYDSNKSDMLYNDSYCKVRETGLEE